MTNSKGIFVVVTTTLEVAILIDFFVMGSYEASWFEGHGTTWLNI